MEFFRDTNIDFLGKKWYFLTVTMVLFVVGMIALAIHHGPEMGIDFTGGTQLDIKFSHSVSDQSVRSALAAAHITDATIQPINGRNSDEMLISLPVGALSEADLEKGKQAITQALYNAFGDHSGKLDFNNIGEDAFTNYLMQKDPNGWAGLGSVEEHNRYAALAHDLLHNGRDLHWGGLVPSMQALASWPGVTPALAQDLSQDFTLAPFTNRGSTLIGPQVGAQLSSQALHAVLYALVGMLIYIAFRFEFIYGVAAVVAVFHDVLITLGMFSVARLPISLTVIAAFLTLVGYSMNDTIVVFDRVRENLPIMRREKLATVVNRSINQTLSRTVLTSGLTFLSVLSLLVLGGEALRGFSFAMTFGILVGTYSSIAVAAPMMVAYIEWRNARQRPLRAGGSRAAAK